MLAMAQTATVEAGVDWQGFREVPGGRWCKSLGVIGSGLLWFFTEKMGAGLFEREAKNSFIWFAWLVTWELETRGLGHGWDKVLDGGHKGICTLGVDWNPKPFSVSLGTLYAYLSGVQCWTLPQVASNTPKS